ncbi:MAG: CRISPR-associated protein Cas4 [Actinomycetota bacterium]|nr:CRISPR-associated protein Cas4 [Actinomycetota bacterium]
MYAEEDLVLISAIEHYSYCPRQFALIHIEQTFRENAQTLSGDRIHERVDSAHTSLHNGVRVEYAAPLWSERFGLVGKADAIEFLGDGTVWPVEYKRGARRAKLHDDLQLCAQALCLEEMLSVPIAQGSIFYHASRRWREVNFDDNLRRATATVVDEIRVLQRSGVTPPPVADGRCTSCSLEEACSPELISTAQDWSIEGLVEGGE